MGFKGKGGTGTQGLYSRGKSHIMCRRCGRRSYHAKDQECAKCGFGKTPKLRKYSWQTKSFTGRKLRK
ncbi:MAG: 50S ribosomal protein L37e [Candidatus Woesearchaeota archaeon]|nr:50S ribosomal protein L37e [Candidatus Woesearchaeota archaeon]MDP7181820.1 50S ribosomal protein L37e [Candidatus Woesearchaeota archaeon]MDP7198996.1 50S ribosomal protein L37e [Candidatus Woesearchaeota archaeon]MDP7467750.1 50S ribosomal protein L37e [Candidatus Woesearchaeota archaeon]MDP7646834.1 50S ribosomal protein L37e [Candidatus Woesearchaeota archaeon]